MPEKIKIDMVTTVKSCDNCPFMFFDVQTDYNCGYEDKVLDSFPFPLLMPEWCPLHTGKIIIQKDE